MTIIRTPQARPMRGMIIFVAALVLFIVFLRIIGLITDWFWFQEVGYQTIFTVTLLAKIKTGALFGAGFFIILYGNLLIALSLSRIPLFGDQAGAGAFGIPHREMEPGLLKILILIGIAPRRSFRRGQRLRPVGEPPPLPEPDPLRRLRPAVPEGYRLLRLPVPLSAPHLRLAEVRHRADGGGNRIPLPDPPFLSVHPPRIWKIAPAARIHLALLVALFFFWGIFGAWLDLNDLLFTKRGVVFGPGYTDVTTQIWVLQLMMGLYGLAGLAALFFAFKPDWRLPAAAILLLIAVSVLGRGIYPSLIQKFQVVPNEIVAEKPYLEKNIQYTRLAYGLTQIEEQEFPTEENLTAKDLQKNNLTIKNIRLWNHGPLLQTYSQLQEMRTYYKFTGVDNDRYTINGEYRQVMLSPREISYPALPSRSWVNEHLTYTHGYGVVLGPVNRISAEGLPEFFIKDIPPVSTTPLKVTRPEIYFGENSNEYVFVRSKQPEFDYPVGDKNVYSRYEGKGGVPLSFLKKLIFAVRFGSITMLLSDDITSESRIVYHRNVRERVSKIAPFAHLDNDPYLVISPEGRLLWFVDGYTTTDRFPYSEPTPELGNYIRNTIKAVVDAYDGTVQLYVSDPTDPIMQTYARIFPGRLQAPGGDAGGPPEPCPLPAGTARDPGADVPGLPHAGCAGLLQQGGPLVDPRQAGRRRPAGDGPLLHDHEAPRGREGGVHPPRTLHPQHEGQHVGLDGGPLRRPPLREGDRLQVPQAEAGLRTPPDRGPDRPGYGDLPAAHPLAAARIERDPGEPAGDPDREIDPLRRIPLPGRLQRPAPRAQAGHRGLRKHHRHGGEPGSRPPEDLRRGADEG